MAAELQCSLELSDNTDVTAEVFDTNAFINEIKMHPCIWNYKSESYSNRTERNSAWTTVCEKFSADYRDKTSREKEEVEKLLQKKWKTLRDGFSRYLHKKKKQKTTPGASQTKQYLYFKQLQFLMAVTADREDSSAKPAKNEQSCSDVAQSCSDVAPRRTNQSSAKRRKAVAPPPQEMATPPAPLPKLAEKRTMEFQGSNYGPEQDEDRLFLLSLSGEFKKILDEYRLDAKSEIIAVLKKFKTLSSHAYQQRVCMQQPVRIYTSSPSSSD